MHVPYSHPALSSFYGVLEAHAGWAQVYMYDTIIKVQSVSIEKKKFYL